MKELKRKSCKQKNNRLTVECINGFGDKEERGYEFVNGNENKLKRKNKKHNFIFKDIAEEWLGNKKDIVKEATYVRYRYLYERYIGSQFGSVRVKMLDLSKIENYILTKQRMGTNEGLAEKTIQDILLVYHSIVRYGIEQKYLPIESVNDTPKKKSVKTNRKQTTILLPQERIKLEQFILSKEEIRHFGIIVAMYTGIRIGELCALKWGDIDLNNGIIYINHTLQRLHDYTNISETKTKIVISTPKTFSSARSIPLSSFLMEKLKFFESSADHYILTNTDKPEEPRSYLYFYKRQLSLCGLPEYTFHAIRHTFATRCIEEGVDVKALSEILGHSNVKITMNRYVHPSLENKRQQLEKLTLSI